MEILKRGLGGLKRDERRLIEHQGRACNLPRTEKGRTATVGHKKAE